MNIEDFKKLIEKSWTKETCSPGLRENWTEENPSLGQCAITAMLVKDIFGGKIMRCMTSTGSHYYNKIGNKIVDLTVDQFLGEIPKYEEGIERTMEYLLSNDDTKKRYLMLKRDFVYNKQVADATEVEEIITDIKIRRKRFERHFGGIK